MAVLTYTAAIAAGATYEPINGWQYEYIPFGGAIEVLHDATAVGVVVTITSGSDTLQERSPVSSGGTAGEMPSGLNRVPVLDEVAAGDRVKLLYENTTGAPVTVQGTITYTPA